MGRIDPGQSFLVLRPAGEIFSMAAERQRLLAKQYKLYERMPMLHVTLLQVELRSKGVLEMLKERAGAIAERAGPILLTAKEYKCYSINNRSITLLLEKTCALQDLSRDLEASLKGFTEVRFLGPSLKEREYHITLASNFFAENPWSEEEFKDLCYHLDKKRPVVSGYASSLEIWRPRLLPKEAILASFPLRGINGQKKTTCFSRFGER